jgi:hypothetical protein
MRIKIAQRLKPYSHEPGALCLLPFTSFRCQLFPALIRIHRLLKAVPELFAEVHLNIAGPVKGFTILQDLEHGILHCWGHAQTGYFQYTLARSAQGDDEVVLSLQKAPQGEIVCNGIALQAGSSLIISQGSIHQGNNSKYCPTLSNERLSLGSHKAQDWNLMRHRMNFEEIFPLWFRIGQMMPETVKAPLEGTAFLLDSCRKAIEARDPLSVIPSFKSLFLAGFEGMLSPRLADDEHQGFHLPPLVPDSPLSPLLLVVEGAALIRSLFIRTEGQHIKVLPLIPPDFHCGRMVGIKCSFLGTLDMEWSKKTIRRLIFRAEEAGECTFEFRHVKSYRLRKNLQDRGERILCGTPIQMDTGSEYLLDNFMH